MKYITGALCNSELSTREEENRKIAYDAALESIVLLKNDNKMVKLDISYFNTKNVPEMFNMFNILSECSKLEDINLSNFNNNEIFRAVGMFLGTSS